MSARPCGCDDAAGWICKMHGDEMERTRFERFQQRLADEEVMKDTTAATEPRHIGDGISGTTTEWEAYPADGAPRLSALADRIAEMEQQIAALRAHAIRADMRPFVSPTPLEQQTVAAFKQRIAATLTTFYTAPLSMSSVQPLLALAEELNPELRRTR